MIIVRKSTTLVRVVWLAGSSRVLNGCALRLRTGATAGAPFPYQAVASFFSAVAGRLNFELTHDDRGPFLRGFRAAGSISSGGVEPPFIAILHFLHRHWTRDRGLELRK